MNMKIAIDGPSGAGKSTIAKRLSEILKIPYLDTGAIFRAVALALIEQGVELKDIREVQRRVSEIDLRLDADRLIVDGVDITDRIRTDEISAAASTVSQYPKVRAYVHEIEMKVSQGSVIMDGRDIGTVVLPDADFKFFITASDTVRANRRVEQLGLDASEYESVLSAIRKRDKQDRTRAEAPLTKAADAILISTDNATVEESVAEILTRMRGVK